MLLFHGKHMHCEECVYVHKRISVFVSEFIICKVSAHCEKYCARCIGLLVDTRLSVGAEIPHE